MKILFLSLLILTGCTTNPIYLKNAKGDVAQCGPYNAVGGHNAVAVMREQQCVQDYQRQGYERFGD